MSILFTPIRVLMDTLECLQGIAGSKFGGVGDDERRWLGAAEECLTYNWRPKGTKLHLEISGGIP